MIVILDTNAYHGDVEVVGQALTTLFDAVDAGHTDPEDIEIWTPRVVVDELVRQWPQRMRRMKKVVAAINHDLKSFGLPRPQVGPYDDAAAEAYRRRLEGRLTGPGRRIADHPSNVGKAIEWAAQHRFPVKPREPSKPQKGQPDLSHFENPKPVPVSGVVDAAIWLTVAEASATGENVALITANSDDFADPRDKSAFHPELVNEIRVSGGHPDRVKRYATVAEFNSAHVAQSAEEAARQFLADHESAVMNEISDAVEWLPVTVDADWELYVDVDAAVLESFDPHELQLVRADETVDGFFMTLELPGEGRLDLMIFKYDAAVIPDESPVRVYDFDWNESMAAAEAELGITLTVQVRVRKGHFEVTIDDVART